AQARGPELLAHVAAGAMPTPVVTGLLHGLLVRSAQFVKCASGNSRIPRLFAHSLREVEPKLASCVELAAWVGGETVLEAALWDEADCVVVSGTDETLDALRRRIPRRVRFVGHGHRVSAGYVAREVLGPLDAPRTIEAAAADVAAWDQVGCLSPHVIYVETGGLLPPEIFAERLAGELARVEERLPRGRVSEAVATGIFERREMYRVRAAGGDGTRIWSSDESTAWTVVYEVDPQFQLSCGNRFVYVKPVDTLEECLRLAEPIRGQWSTVGLSAAGLRVDELAQQFASWGVTRVCPLGRMQSPPLTWRHDGRPVLGDLVTWTNHERPPE
ncbi:MAG: acyl-CoA reductase, partial [Limisphaerales bacterium]